jgi:class 3 adenylate cyclase/tetratricopeptide (TPR) repeat protein
MMDVGAWLRSIGLGEYADAFADNHIDESVLPTLTSGDLKELGVLSIGHRKRLLAAIAELSRKQPEREDVVSPGREVLTEGERRQVTVLFADLSGYTELTGRLDAEELHEVTSRFFEALDEVIESYGGTVDKHIGDCVMAVFGAPTAHGNDPERAIRAALAIHDAVMPRVSEAVGHELQVHIGIATGQVVASRAGGPGQAFALTGESVNLASRLTDAAGPGETLISKALYQAHSDVIIGEDAGELMVKGFDQPLQIRRVLGLRDQGAETGRRPFVGRRAELSQFEGIVTACREAGSGMAVYVRGEAGIGKSRLVDEFRRVAMAQGFACHTGLVLDFGVGEGRDAIRALVRSLLGLPAGAEVAARAAAGDRAVAHGLVAADQRVFLNDLLDLPQPTELRAIYDAMDSSTRNRGRRGMVVDLIRCAGARQPLMLTVEDLHWADAITLAYLAELAAAVPEIPVLLVMTSRIEGDPIDEAWRGATRGTPLLTIDVGPLRRQEAIALAGSSLETMSRLAMACVERAEGNPLFLEQLLRNAEETTAAHLPGSIQSLVLARVDNLEPLDRRALQAASIIGQRFSLAVLCHLLQAPGYTCAGLVKHYLVRPDGDDYIFAHALIWEGVYSTLLQARKRELHRRAAEWFAGIDPALRAEHLDRAEDPGAPRAYLEAAEVQSAAYRPARALKLIERGLALATERRDIYELTCARARMLQDLGSIAESIEAYGRCLEVAADDVERCRGWLGQASGMRITDQFDEAFGVLEQAEAVARRHRLAAELARVHYLRGSLYFPLGEIDGCLQEHELARRDAQQAGSAELEARALSGLADAHSMSARIKTAHDFFDHCIEIARAHGFGRIEVANRHMRGIMRYYQNDLRGAVEDTLGGAEAAAKVGQQRAEMVARAASGYILPDLGELDRAKDQCEQALALARHLGARRFEASSLRHLARVIAAQGHAAEALALLDQAYAISSESGITFAGPWVLGALAVITEDPDQRRWALEQGEQVLGRGCVFHNYFWFYRDAIEVALTTADWAGLERYANALERFTAAEPVPWTSFFIARGQALGAHYQGRRDRATIRELRRLRDEAVAAGFRSALPALERAIAAAPALASSAD